nr:ribonuclease H-like domain, reverse transcriptase, RNA-dependent DNA polymerase [Tanacetum cinerariifolium]
MPLIFADTHNMVAYLNKSDASKGFNQVIDFLNASYNKYALTINPHIYVSCVKQFWNIVVVKQSNDVTRLQALVDKKKVVITKATIRDALCLDDADGVDCLPNEEIFAELARMGYEKPSTKLTFYKAFFSSQWKLLIYTILQSMSAKRTSWNEFSSSMASAVICLSTSRKFNFSTYIFESLVRNVDSSFKFYMYPRFIQLIIKNQLGDLSTHTTKYTSPALTQKVFANMRRVGKGFSRAETPLFEGMLVEVFEEEGDAEEQVQDDVDDAAAQGADTAEALDACAALTRQVEHLEYDKVAQALEITKLKRKVKKLEKRNKVKVLKLRRMIDDLDKDDAVDLMDDKGEEKKEKEVKDDQVKGRQAEIYQTDMDHALKVLSMQEDEPKVQEVVDVVTTAKLITEVVTAASESVTAASTTIAAKKIGVVIKDPEEESTTIIPADTKSKDKGKGIIVEEPKPPKKKQYVEMDEEYTRKLHEELNKDIDWDVAIDHVKQKAKEDPFVQRYQGMSYDDIHPIFEAKFNSNISFLLKSTEQLEEKENRAIESINETPAQKVAKRRKLNKEVKDLKRHLEIMPDEDDDVYTEATPLVRKVPVVDYEIKHLNNKPHYKIIRADGTHKLYVSFVTLLKNFDKEDLESLWSLVKERFSTSKPNNFSDDLLLTTLGAMFKRPDGQAQVLKNKRSVHGQAKEIPNLKVYIRSNVECSEAESGRTKYVVPAVVIVNPAKFVRVILGGDIHYLFNTNGNNKKSLGKDSKGGIIILPPISFEEHVAVQRETKARTLLLQSLPENHMADFHHLDDAREIWLAMKARFSGNEESKKMRKTMQKQEFSEFREIQEQGDAEEQVQDDIDDAAAQGADTAIEGDDRIESSDDTDMEDASNKGRMIDELDRDEGVALIDDVGAEKKAEEAQFAGDDHVKGRQAEIYKIDMDHASKVLSMQEDKPKVQEVVDVVSTTKLITEVVTAASTTIVAVEPQVPSATITAAPKTQKVEMDEEYARKLYEELNKDIDWDVAIDHVKQKAKEDQLDYFKGMSYDDIRPIFEAKSTELSTEFIKSKEQIEEEDNKAIQCINETPAQKAAKKRKLKILNSIWRLCLMKMMMCIQRLLHLQGRPDGQAQVWKNQRIVHGQARVKS